MVCGVSRRLLAPDPETDGAPRRKRGRTTHSAVLLSTLPEKKEIVAADTGVVLVLLQNLVLYLSALHCCIPFHFSVDTLHQAPQLTNLFLGGSRARLDCFAM